MLVTTSRWICVAVTCCCFFIISCSRDGAQSTPPAAEAAEPAPLEELPAPEVPDELTSEELIAQADVYYAKCGGEVLSMADILMPITEKMHRQHIAYSQVKNPDQWRDCSGNFLRLSSYVAAACPGNTDHLAAPPGITDYVPGGTNAIPGRAKARDSRSLGKWYHEQGRFMPIFYDDVMGNTAAAPQDLITNRNRIKPGSVLWFARAQPTRADGLDGLWGRGTSGAHINHMATVRAVTRDEGGNVVGFEMYHGRREGKPGAVTKSHFWEWPDRYTNGGTTKYPPLGYWGQYLVGIGTLLPAEVPPPSTG